jgi:RNA:NAD 2'-phosphotransferase (TPT1/KptA family)
MGVGAVAAINLVLGLLDRAAAIGSLIQTAQAQGRDITEAELDQLVAQDDAARVKLDQAIAAARAAPKK